MSEYMEIETEIDDEFPDHIYFYTNMPLTRPDAPAERYESAEEMAEGSALAQALTAVEGVLTLELEGTEMTVIRDLEAPEHAIVADISAVLKDFFL
ncbi:MAG: hypothetical protein QNJ45_10005 [Ardenticatenaceae bacterium]|nr:hypothetical protein [Ardenticatenaceae bacterium]